MELFEKIEEACLNKTRDFHHDIIGMDKELSAVRKSNQNVKNANLTEFIKMKAGNFFDSAKEGDAPLHIIFNPPYGERLTVDTEAFYSQIGDTLKQSYPGTNAWFITSNIEGLKYVGLRPSRKIKVFNGKLASRLVKYEMYAGSKKAKFQDKNSKV